jgi:hypothetical protein
VTTRRTLPTRRITSGVRFRDGEFELRCSECAVEGGVTAYWPITTEFWDPRNLTACRAHLLKRKRLKAKERYWLDPETERRRTAQYHAANDRVRRLKTAARWAELDEAERAALRAYRRMRYAARRAAELAANQPVVSREDRRRAYNRDWMRQKRAEAA